MDDETKMALSRLAKLSLDIANMLDFYDDNFFEVNVIKDLGAGYATVADRLRKGVKAIADIQAELFATKSRLKYVDLNIMELRKAMLDIFGDIDIELLTEDEKKELREFTEKLFEGE